MCHISRENVWRIIEKASLQRKSVGTRPKGTPFKLKGKRRRTAERAIKRFERKGETFPPVWRKIATSQDYSQDVSARTVSPILNF